MTRYQDLAADAGHPTHNPDGITTSNYDYWPRTQEEKAAAVNVPFATIVNQELAMDAPYPTGDPISENEAFEVLTRAHTPNELVPEDKRIETNVRGLAAGGAIEVDELRELRTGL
jgi:hypothetical protein